MNILIEQENLNNALIATAKTGDTKTFKVLRIAGGDVRARARDGSALECAAYGGHVEIVEDILKILGVDFSRGSANLDSLRPGDIRAIRTAIDHAHSHVQGNQWRGDDRAFVKLTAAKKLIMLAAGVTDDRGFANLDLPPRSEAGLPGCPVAPGAAAERLKI